MFLSYTLTRRLYFGNESGPVIELIEPLARAILTTSARDADNSIIVMMRFALVLACTTATFAFVPHLKVAAKIRMSAVAGGDAPAVEVPKAKAVEAEAPKVAPSPAEDPFDQPKAEAKAAPAAAADAPPKKAPAKADEADEKKGQANAKDRQSK